MVTEDITTDISVAPEKPTAKDDDLSYDETESATVGDGGNGGVDRGISLLYKQFCSLNIRKCDFWLTI